jgi:hypothetical protein
VFSYILLQAALIAAKLGGGGQGWTWRAVFTPAWIVELAVAVVLLVAIPATCLAPYLASVKKKVPPPDEFYWFSQINTTLCLCLFLPPVIFQILLCVRDNQQVAAQVALAATLAALRNASGNTSGNTSFNNSNSSSSSMAGANVSTPLLPPAVAGGEDGVLGGFWVASPLVLCWMLTLVFVLSGRIVSWCSKEERFHRKLQVRKEDANSYFKYISNVSWCSQGIICFHRKLLQGGDHTCHLSPVYIHTGT